METQTTANFPKFEQNQILSSSHLNQLRQYLDESNRLTRVRLSGVGIVCGLKLTYNKTTDKSIRISSGYGITTEGYLIELDETLFTHYKSYYDPSDPYYEFGHAITDDGLNETTGVEVKYPEPTGSEPARSGSPVLYELLESTSTETKLPLSGLAGINNMAVVLYLELVDEALKKCTGTNCDNKGTNRVMTVRALLVDKSELFTYDREALLTTPDELLPLNIPRLNNNDLIAVGLDVQLQALYQGIVYPNQFLTKVKNAFTSAYNTYHVRLGLSGKHIQAAKDALDVMQGITKQYQYVTGGLKDIVVTYNEFAGIAYEFSDTCGPTVTTFPRHLTIGALVPDEMFPYDQYRTDFFNALPPDRNNKTLLKAQMLFQKMLQLALCFKIPVSTVVDITPGKYVPLTLSDWSVPFYYDPNFLVEADANGKGDLLKLWSPAQTLRKKQRERTGYYSEVFSQNLYFTKSFGFSVEQLPFYRVEGVQGKDRDEVLKKLKELKNEYNLGFKVVAVRIDKPGDLLEFEDCSFGDLQEEYYFHRKRVFDFLDLIYEYLKIARTYMTGDEGATVDKVFEFIQPRYDEMKAVLPECLKEFDYSKFKTLYKTYLNHFIDLLLATGFLKAIAKVLPAKEADGVSSVESLLSLLLSLGSRAVYKLIDSVFYSKLYRIYYRYTDRIYRRRLQLKFSRFAERHPGMEHLGGVRNHETLVLVYQYGVPENPTPSGKGVSYIPDENEREKAERQAKERERRKKKEVEDVTETRKKILDAIGDIDPNDESSRERIEEILQRLKGKEAEEKEEKKD
ncbi:MAG: hypothetical protein M3R17_12465 [Bacteroidota bacterium]|nr:hypothetical protein [Bacteroidota bacterium]